MSAVATLVSRSTSVLARCPPYPVPIHRWRDTLRRARSADGALRHAQGLEPVETAAPSINPPPGESNFRDTSQGPPCGAEPPALSLSLGRTSGFDGIRGGPKRATASWSAALRAAFVHRLAFLLLLTFATGLAPLHANQRIDMVLGARAEIDFIEYLENAPPTGWLPVGFKIVNRAPQPREWRVRFECEVGPGVNQLGEWALRVPANETREVQVFVPQAWFVSGGYHAIRGYVSGPDVANGGIYVSRSSASRSQSTYTGMSHALAAENWSRLESELDPGKSSGMHTSTGTELVGSRFDPTQVPADWRTWSGFATIWLHRGDWIGLAGAQRLALQRWVAQGGHLYLCGSGAGLDDLPKLEAMRTPAGSTWQTGTLGFGVVTRVPFEDDATPTRLPIAEVATFVRGSLGATPALARLDTEIPVTEAEKTLGMIRPGGPLLGVLIAGIAILLGPVNLFLLAPAQRRARLFITVPIISLGGALALVGLILLQDGTGGRGQRGVLISLIPDRPEALVLQEQCAMTGLLFNRSFQVAEDTTVIDYTENDSNRSYRAGSHRAPRGGLDRTGPLLHGDWFTSRTVHAHHLRSFVPTRAALTLTASPDGAPSVLSTCPGVLRDLIVIDGEGHTWWAAEVPPGRSVVLETAGPLMVGRWTDQLQRFGVSLAATTGRKEPSLTFHASVDSWDETVPVPTLPSIRWRTDTILVTGPVREARP